MAYDLTAVLRLRDEFSGNLTRATRGLGGMSSAASTASAAITGVAVAIGAVAGAGAVAIAKTGIQYNAMLEQSTIAWETLLGSQQEAVDQIKTLQEMGAKTPFEFEGLDKAAKLLNMSGYEGKELTKVLTNVGDAVSAVGGGQAELEGVSMALFQMSAKGKASAEEMNQLAERGIPAWQLLADSMGKTVPELMKMSENGKLMAKDVLPALIDGMGNKFGGAMDKQSKTFNGMMSSLRDNFKMLSAEIMEPVFGKILEFMPKVLAKVEELKAAASSGGLAGVIKSILPEEDANLLIGSFNAIKTAAETVFNFITGNWPAIRETLIGITAAVVAYKIAMMGMAIVGVVTKLMASYRAVATTMTVTQWALNAAMTANPIGLVIAAIAALIGVGVMLYRNWDTVKKKAAELFGKLVNMKTSTLALLGPFGLIIKAGIEVYKNWDKIKATAKDVFGAVKGWIGGVKDKWDAFKESISNFKIPKFGLPKVLGGNGLIQTDGSHYHGLSYVPKNGYQATLHKGERVLTAKENREYDKGTGGITIAKLADQIIVREDADIDRIAAALAMKLREAGGAGA